MWCVVSLECIRGTSVAPALRRGVGGHESHASPAVTAEAAMWAGPWPKYPATRVPPTHEPGSAVIEEPPVETADRVGAKVNVARERRLTSMLLEAGPPPGRWRGPGRLGPRGTQRGGGLLGLGSGRETAPGHP